MTLTSYRITRDGADRLLFLMHGYTAEQHHLASYVPLVDPDERFTAIAPRGPMTMPDGDGAGWWHIDLDTFEPPVEAANRLATLEASRQRTSDALRLLDIGRVGLFETLPPGSFTPSTASD